jgi:hypothetical protein
MPWEPIIKSVRNAPVDPNLQDYEQACAVFSWPEARRGLDGLPGGRGLNIAHEAIDRHAAGPRRDRVAIHWLGKDGATKLLFRPAGVRNRVSRSGVPKQSLGTREEQSLGTREEQSLGTREEQSLGTREEPIVNSSFPNSCLGTHFSETPVSACRGAKQSFADIRSQTEFGNEGEAGP